MGCVGQEILAMLWVCSVVFKHFMSVINACLDMLIYICINTNVCVDV